MSQVERPKGQSNSPKFGRRDFLRLGFEIGVLATALGGVSAILSFCRDEKKETLRNKPVDGSDQTPIP